LNLHFTAPSHGCRPGRGGRPFRPGAAATDEEVHKVLLRIRAEVRGLLLPKQPDDPIDALDAGYAESSSRCR